MDTPGPMRSAVQVAIAGRTPDARDVGTEQLATHYADLLDDAAPGAKYAKPLRVLAAAVAASEDPDTAEAYDLIRTALARHTVASDLGPKLLAALDALGLTTKSRAAIGRKEGGQDEPADPLDELRDELDERRRRKSG